MPVDTQQSGHLGGGPPPLMAIASPPPPPLKPNSRKLLSLLFKSIIMAFIVSLFILFLGVAALALLHFFLASTTLHIRRQRNHRPRRHSVVAQSSSSSSPGCSIKDLQKRIPKLKYSGIAQPNETKDCSICLEAIKDGDWCRNLPSCRHIFHQNCVDNWLTRVANCPICRTRVQLDSSSSCTSRNNVGYELLWEVGVGR